MVCRTRKNGGCYKSKGVLGPASVAMTPRCPSNRRYLFPPPPKNRIFFPICFPVLCPIGNGFLQPYISTATGEKKPRHLEAEGYVKSERERRVHEYCFADNNRESRSDHERYDCLVSEGGEMLVVVAEWKRTRSWKSVYIDQNDFSAMIEKPFDQSTH